MSGEQFTCAMCGGTFDKERSDATAVAEAEALFGGDVMEDAEVVCDDCFQRVGPGGFASAYRELNDLIEAAASKAAPGKADEVGAVRRDFEERVADAILYGAKGRQG